LYFHLGLSTTTCVRVRSILPLFLPSPLIVSLWYQLSSLDFASTRPRTHNLLACT
jgi:hypothetical protein